MLIICIDTSIAIFLWICSQPVESKYLTRIWRQG
ncbi:unnamed protein product, partial [Allacma fusca]